MASLSSILDIAAVPSVALAGVVAASASSSRLRALLSAVFRRPRERSSIVSIETDGHNVSVVGMTSDPIRAKLVETAVIKAAMSQGLDERLAVHVAKAVVNVAGEYLASGPSGYAERRNPAQSDKAGPPQ